MYSSSAPSRFLHTATQTRHWRRQTPTHRKRQDRLSDPTLRSPQSARFSSWREGFCIKSLRPTRWTHLHGAADASISPAGSGDDSEETTLAPEVFPRIRESNPYRLLGLSPEATFEEIQDARNYYYETYQEHEASREAIESAFDHVLNEHMKKRKKYGFRAAKLRRKTDKMEDDIPPKSLLQRFLECFESYVPLTTIVNDGVIYLLLSFWAAGTQYATEDPSGPIVVAIGFCAWRIFDKRQKRNPDGPFFGGSPIWGALGTTLLAFIISTIFNIIIIPILPWPAKFRADALGACLSILVIGFVSIFVK